MKIHNMRHRLLAQALVLPVTNGTCHFSTPWNSCKSGGLLKIHFLITHNMIGGAPLAMRRIIHLLGERGHTCKMVHLYRLSDGYPLMSGDIMLLDRNSKGNALGLMRSFAALVKLLRRDRPDAIVSFLPLANVLGALAGVVAGVPRRLPSHRSPLVDVAPPLRILDRVWGALGVYTRIICVSDSVRASFASQGRAYAMRTTVIPNAADVTASTVSHAQVRALFGIPGDCSMIVGVGGLLPRKGFDVLLPAMAKVGNAYLVLAGDGRLRMQLEQAAREHGVSDRVIFAGNRPREEVFSIVAASDLYVQPTLYEGQSNALLEALALGAVVVSSDVDTQREVLELSDGRLAGLLVQERSPEAWAASIRRALDDTDLRDRLRTAALARAADFTLQEVGDRYERLLGLSPG